MKEYRIAEASNPESAERTVNRLLGEGWQIQGNLAVAVSGKFGAIFAQAMVRDVEQRPEPAK